MQKPYTCFYDIERIENDLLKSTLATPFECMKSWRSNQDVLQMIQLNKFKWYGYVYRMNSECLPKLIIINPNEK